MTTTKEKKIQALLEQIDKELSYAISSMVFSLSSGLSLACHSNKPIDFSVTAAYNAEGIKQKYKALEAVKMPNEKVDEMIITLTSQVHMVKAIDSDNYLYIAFEKDASSNLGMAKVTIEKYAKSIQEVLAS